MIESKTDLNKSNLLKEMDNITNKLGLKSIEEASYFPKFVQIETTRICNAKCPFCAIDDWDKSTPIMPEVLFKKIIDEVKDYSDWINWVCVQKAGEPLLDKRIAMRIAYIKDSGIKNVIMSTNASLLFEERAREILEAGIDDIMFSIDSVIKDEYEKMRVGLDFETVIDNIKTFFKLRDEIRPQTIIRVRGVSFFDLKKDEERKHLIEWENFWNPLQKSHDRIYMKRAHNWGNQQDWNGNIKNNKDIYHPCIIPWSTMTISAMGIVGLCVNDYDSKMNLGDVNKNTISEIWNNDKWGNIRKLHSEGKRNNISFCKGCRLYDQEYSIEKKSIERESDIWK